MAFNFKIRFNFFVVTDTVSSVELINELKEQLKYTSNTSDVFKIHFKEIVENGSTRTFVLGGEQQDYDFASIIDDTTGVAFTSVDNLKDFLSTNLGA